MPVIGISILKSTLFRGVQQEFSNVYYYEADLPTTAVQAETLIDSIVATEKKLHASVVNFLFARCWSAGGTKEQNQMIFQKPLSGTGSASENVAMDRERALLVRWRAGVDKRGKPVYLRKYYHSCGPPAGVIIDNQVLNNTAQLSSASRDAVEAIADEGKVRNTALQGYQLSSSNGRNVTGETECHRYLEHHQLGDQWRQ